MDLNKSRRSHLGSADGRLDVHEGVVTVDALKVNKTLSNLQLDHNSITDAGAIVLSHSLRVNKTLQVLNLFKCRIGDRGIEALAEALETNITLKEFNIGQNQITDYDENVLAIALTEKSTMLEHVSISFNEITDVGAAAIAHAFSLNKSVRYFDISYNNISHEGFKNILQPLKINTTLTTLKVTQFSRLMKEYEFEEAVADLILFNKAIDVEYL
ncbi:unnamed protein product [Didymodactylos carnosus]|uniref:Ran GTPase-activating protein n=1 Tax=Didymodactylos carnosus TaxID=1234261 RepID=A0A8S2J0D5_9BILA|nr:unnamed protein product [Didymodactylos carnosus]CAF3785395.1 unnamed protein product [Didymodactylos carnosus]